MRSLADFANRVAVQVFKHVPWATDLWLKGHPLARQGGPIPWTPLRKPLAGCRVALVTTGGVHLTDEPAFNMADPKGDPSVRTFPSGTAPEALRITHKYYDHRAADRDLNVVLPRDPLGALVAGAQVGAVGPTCYSLMGHILGPHLRTLTEATAPEIARRLRAEAVDLVVLTPA